MKKIIFKLTRVAIAAIMVVGSTTFLNAQPNPNNDGIGGGLGLGGSGIGDGGTATVPFDTNMTLLFAGTAIMFIAYKYKKGQLSILG